MKKYLIVLSALVLFAFSSCSKITLSGNNITKEFSIDGPYTELAVENAFDVTVSDAVSQITVTTDENVMPRVRVEQIGEKVRIYLKPLTVNSGMELKVLVPHNVDLNTVTLSGASEFHTSFGLNGRSIQMGLSGASSAYCDIQSEGVYVNLSGASDFRGNINADDVTVRLSGASNFYGDILADEIDMDLTGASNIEGKVDATELDVDLGGASDAIFEGQVTTLKIDLVGSSNIVKKVIGNRYALICGNCEGEMSGSSDAYIHCDGNIRVNLSGASELHFTGEAFTADSHITGGSGIIHDVLP